MSFIRRRPIFLNVHITILFCFLSFQNSNGLLPSSTVIANVRKSPHSFSSIHSQFSSNGNGNEPADSEQRQRSGLLVLLTVPVAWGSFEPATRFVYATDPALPSLLFSVAYYFVAAVTLVSLTLVRAATSKNDDAADGTTEIIRTATKWPVLGGIELGLYLFVGNLLQVLGLKTVPSDRAAFLLQLTTIIVPLLEAFRSKQVSTRTWCACLVALVGVAVMGLENKDEASSLIIGTTTTTTSLTSPESLLTLPMLSNGDLMIAAAAVAYSFHCIRLEKYAQTTSAILLAASKAVTETICSVLTIVAVLWYSTASLQQQSNDAVGKSLGLLSTFALESGNEIANYMVMNHHPYTYTSVEPTVIAAICWTGWVTVAYTIYAQSYGQSRVKPTTANLIYTIQPICTALIAWFLLGEGLSPLGWLGGSLIGMAVLLVALPTSTSITSSTSTNVDS